MNKGGSNFGQSKVVQGTKDTNNEEKKLNKKKNHDNKGVQQKMCLSATGSLALGARGIQQHIITTKKKKKDLKT